MTAAVYALAVCFLAAAGLAGWLFQIDQPVPGWTLVIALILTLLTLLGMIASTARAERDR